MAEIGSVQWRRDVEAAIAVLTEQLRPAREIHEQKIRQRREAADRRTAERMAGRTTHPRPQVTGAVSDGSFGRQDGGEHA